MFSVPTEVPAAERARWLAELSEALNQAQLCLLRMDLRGDYKEAYRLFLSIEAARFEVQSLLLSRSLRTGEGNDPIRTESSPWAPLESFR